MQQVLYKDKTRPKISVQISGYIYSRFDSFIFPKEKKNW